MQASQEHAQASEQLLSSSRAQLKELQTRLQQICAEKDNMLAESARLGELLRTYQTNAREIWDVSKTAESLGRELKSVREQLAACRNGPASIQG